MIHNPVSQASAARPPVTHRGASAMLVIAVSACGVAASALIWLLRGWVDGLGCYVLTIGAVAVLLLWQTGLRPNAAPGDVTTARAGTGGLVLPGAMAIVPKAESGLNQQHG